MKDLETLDAAFLIDTFLLLLIGIGPKIALVPFLDATVGMPEASKRSDRARSGHGPGQVGPPRVPARDWHEPTRWADVSQPW